MVPAEAMSEFKFACPVCGQHITADSSTSGGQLECPTCFQKIVVPQAPASDETKFILSASQVAKPRPSSADAASRLGPLHTSSNRSSIPAVVALLVLLCAAGAAVFVFRDRIFKSARVQPPARTNAPVTQPTVPVVRTTTYPIPTNITWTLELTNAVLPDTPAAGSVHGCGFVCERTTLEGGTLSLRQGRTWPPDMGFTIFLTAHQGEDLAGKTVEITPDRTPPPPRIILRWKDDQQQPQKVTISGGYALKVTFGQPAHGRMPGKIFLCLPDAAKSFVGGSFDAEIRRPKPPGPPRTPKPKS
jgi:DNA-directed RNA polymerase subunit RPC12/RpoP